MFILTMSARASPYLRLEELGEDGVVEGLRAQQADGEGEAPGDLARLAGLHDRRAPRPGSPCRPARCARPRPRSPRGRPAGWPSRCSGSRPWPARPPWMRATGGTAFQVDPSPSRPDTRAASITSCSKAQMSRAETRPPSWPGACDVGVGGPGQHGAPGDARHLVVGARAGRTGGSRCRAPRCGSAGRPGCTGCSPSGRGCSCRARRRRRRGRACRRRRCRRSRGRRRGRR